MCVCVCVCVCVHAVVRARPRARSLPQVSRTAKVQLVAIFAVAAISLCGCCRLRVLVLIKRNRIHFSSLRRLIRSRLTEGSASFKV